LPPRPPAIEPPASARKQRGWGEVIFIATSRDRLLICTLPKAPIGGAKLIADNRVMVTKKPKGLGLGLEALLGPKVAEAPAAGAPLTLRLTQLLPGKYQPRSRVDEGSLYELAQSIKSQGVIQPVLVRPVGSGRFEVIAGERRVRAANLAGLLEVPVLVREVNDKTAAVMALIENIQREDLNPLEEAQGLQRLVNEFKLTHEQAAQAVGRSRSAASNLLRLLNLAAPVQKMLMAHEIEMGHARALLALPAADQILTANRIVAKKLSVREAEKLAGRAAGNFRAAPSARPTNAKSRDLVRLEEQLSDVLAAAVEIRLHRKTRRGNQGEIVIAFDSLDELNTLLARLGVGGE
jgi:ParB family chromosome partitioning protein